MITKSNYPIFLGAVLNQTIVLITTYFVLSLSNPSNYGRFSYFIAIVSIIASISTLKLEQSIVISQNDTEVSVKVWLILILNTIVTCVSLLLISCFIEFSTLELLLFLPLSFGIVMIANFQQIFLFKNQHKYNALISITVSFINFIIVYFCISYEWGLVLGYSFSYFLVSFLVFFLFIKKKILRFASWKEIKNIFVLNINYVKFIFPSSIVTILLAYFHPILLEFVYDQEVVGEFSLSLRILMLPSIVFGGILGGLLRTKLAVYKFSNSYTEFRSEIVKAVRYLFLSIFILFPIIIFLISIAVNYLDFLEWRKIPVLSFFLVGYAISQYLYIPLINIPLVLDKGKVLFKSNLYVLSNNLLVYVVVYVFKLEFTSFLIILSISNLLLVFYQLYVFTKLKIK
ncbi:MATE family efflux transporter [Myroides odoratimimus]|uniref:hypothetical protein n=1 Tax=Myroides odoratimimus TaxID=76832 RepID=UPI001CE0FA8D|nr:hypothetical protein [Myroides odoratimimus]MCA4793872.1 oligosaccharide flippase family protein [Myroides odoratimimus]MCA4821132.1 oligosaccharide flippase family protein [Myroides odoratimimus]